MDSSAFTELLKYGRYRDNVKAYAQQINTWRGQGTMLRAVAQDYMCEPYILNQTGLTITEHQRLTIARYDELLQHTDAPIMPVLQGYAPTEYVNHIRQYGDRLTHGMWVGVGSVCKRQGTVDAIERVLDAILTERPDLRLHGFGVKTIALESSIVRDALYSSDSMAWSYAARREARDANDWQEAAAFVDRIEHQIIKQRHGVQRNLL